MAPKSRCAPPQGRRRGSGGESWVYSKGTAVLVGMVCVVLGLIFYFCAQVTPVNLVTVMAGGVILLWQVVLLTVPWGLYFQARAVVRQLGISGASGIDAPPERAVEAARIARRLRLIAIAGHLLSALVAAVITFFSGRSVGYYFSGFYLLSTLFRPAQAYFAHLRGHLSTMMQEARFPPDDVRALKEQLRLLERQLTVLGEQLVLLHKRADHVDGVEERLVARTDQVERRLVARSDAVTQQLLEQSQTTSQQVQALGRRFEDAVDSITDNQQLVTGLRAFLRLLRTEQA